MLNHKSETNFIFFFLIGFLVLTFFIFKPYLYAIITAGAFATVFYPIYKKILKKVKSNIWAALVTTVLIILIIIAPLSFAGVQIISQATGLYTNLVADQTVAESGFQTVMRNIESAAQSIAPGVTINFKQYLAEGLTALLGRFGGFFTGTFYVVINIFIAILACFYFLKNSDELKERAASLLPLRVSYLHNIISELESAVDSIIRGSMVIALVQGILLGTGFFMFGVPNALLWGSIGAIAALIPGLGTALVSAPAIIYLFATDNTGAAVGLIVWSMALVGMIDNLLSPYLIGRGMKIHSFFVLLSILGGIAFFGPLGIILGPLTLSLLFALLSTYSAIQKEQLD